MIYGKLPVVFLSTIASEKKDNTNSKIAAYLLDGHVKTVPAAGVVADVALMIADGRVKLLDFGVRLLDGGQQFFPEGGIALFFRQFAISHSHTAKRLRQGVHGRGGGVVQLETIVQ